VRHGGRRGGVVKNQYGRLRMLWHAQHKMWTEREREIFKAALGSGLIYN
jgi:hypothetical protein